MAYKEASISTPRFGKRECKLETAYDRMIAGTPNLQDPRPTGYAPSFHAVAPEIIRMSSSASGRALLLMILQLSLGRAVKQGAPWMDVTQEVSTADLANLCRCDQRTIQREVADLVRRKVILCHQPKKGWYVFKPLFRSWASLPAAEPGPLEEPEEIATEPEPEEAKKLEKQAAAVTRVTKRPVVVAAGQTSKPVAIEGGVRDFECWADSDVKFSATLHTGRLRISIFNNLASKTRQPCPDLSDKLLKTNEESKKQTKGEETAQLRRKHPRADELENLFDPLVMRWCRRPLSNHPATVDLACQAIAEVPHDYLVKLAVDRAGREIKSPKHVVAICRDIARDWAKYKDLPEQQRRPARKVPTREEIDALIAKERVAKRSA